jgi:copper chaperone NosL
MNDHRCPFRTGMAKPLLPAIALLLAACGDPGTRPAEVRWDRATCERCRMVLSDRYHAAQVRERTPDGHSTVYRFDDLGCAVIWLADRPHRDDPTTEIWVNDRRTGAWIDARTAAYVPNEVTPMGYGLGAQPQAGPETLSFAQARDHVAEVERRLNVHGGHLETGEPPRVGGR